MVIPYILSLEFITNNACHPWTAMLYTIHFRSAILVAELSGGIAALFYVRMHMRIEVTFIHCLNESSFPDLPLAESFHAFSTKSYMNIYGF